MIGIPLHELFIQSIKRRNHFLAILGKQVSAAAADCHVIRLCGGNYTEIGGAGMIKKVAAVINLVTTDEYFKENPIPYLTDKELERYSNLVLESVTQIFERLDEANVIINA